MTSLEIAQAATSRGWRVFPLGKNKKPAISKWPERATTDPATLLAWFTGKETMSVGIATGVGSGLVVVDVDLYKDGAKEWLEANDAQLPETLTALTGRGGYHLYFQHPGDKVANSSNRLGPGIDVRGDGGFVVAVGCIHTETGKPYTWALEAPLAVVPAWLGEQFSAPRERAPLPAGEFAPAHPRELRAARLYLDRHGEGGMFDACCKLLNDLALSPDEARPLLQDWNMQLPEPGTAEDIESRMAHALEYAKGKRGEGRVLSGKVKIPTEPSQLLRSASPKRRPCTDLGNAERLLDHSGEDLRFVHDWGQWLLWDGRRWAEDHDGGVYRAVNNTVRGIIDEVDAARAEATASGAEAETIALATGYVSLGEVPKSKEQQKAEERKLAAEKRADALAAWAFKSEGAGHLADIPRIARSLSGIKVYSAQLNADPMLFGAGNGTLDLRTGKLRESDRAALITKGSPFSYDPNATCPLWEEFLSSVLPDDLVSFLQVAFGYSMTGLVTEQRFFFLHGQGGNGKGATINTVLKVMGDYAKMGAQTLIQEDKFGSRHTTEIAALQGVRMSVVDETESNSRFPEASIKRLTGGGALTARKMRMDDVTFEPSHKLWITGNNKPAVRDAGESMWRRILPVPFQRVLREDERDGTLEPRLLKEGSGILAWLVRGCLRWQQEGLVVPATVQKSLNEYRQDQDVVGQFLEERTQGEPGASVSAATLYTAWRLWAEGAGHHPMNMIRFKDDLERRGMRWRHTRGGNVWEGFKMLPPGTSTLRTEVSDGVA